MYMYRTLLCLRFIFLACGNAPAQIEQATLPEDPVIRQWVLDVEEVYEAVLEVRHWTRFRPDGWEGGAPRIEELLHSLGERLPEDDIVLRNALYLASWAYRDVAPNLATVWRARCGLEPRSKFSAEHYRLKICGEPNGRAPATLPAEAPWQHLDRVRRGRVGLWDRTFEQFAEPLPDLPRLQRVLALYYPGPGVGCYYRKPIGGGETNWRVVVLRSTARLYPDRLATTLSWLHNPATMFTVYEIGNGGTSPNIVRLLEELLAEAPGQLEALRSVFPELAAPWPRIAWRPIRAYLQDGAPRVTPAIILERLGGSEDQRLWALTWLQDFRREPEPLDPIFAESLREVRLTGWTDRERNLALRALRRLDLSEGDER
ncbi:MAG: hypothetical protein RL885_24430 [Planctomycetota bacterium]